MTSHCVSIRPALASAVDGRPSVELGRRSSASRAPGACARVVSRNPARLRSRAAVLVGRRRRARRTDCCQRSSSDARSLGTVVTSMPFLDGGGPCSTSPGLSRLLFEQLIAEARRRGAKFVDIRCAEPLPTGDDAARTQGQHEAGASRTIRRCCGNGSTRTCGTRFAKPKRSGLSFEFGGQRLLAPFYEIFAGRMHDLGSPVHDQRFFRRHPRIIRVRGLGSRWSRRARTTIGGLIALAFRGDRHGPLVGLLDGSLRAPSEHAPLLGNDQDWPAPTDSRASTSGGRRGSPGPIASSASGARRKSRSSGIGFPIVVRPRHRARPTAAPARSSPGSGARLPATGDADASDPAFDGTDPMSRHRRHRSRRSRRIHRRRPDGAQPPRRRSQRIGIAERRRRRARPDVRPGGAVCPPRARPSDV